MSAVIEVPDLRVVSLDRIRPHEEVDPLRVAPLATRIRDEGNQLNPMMCIETDGEYLVLLDGATRNAALRSLGLGYCVVQVVESATVSLGTWHHVVCGPEPDSIFYSLTGLEGLTAAAIDRPPRVWGSGREPVAVAGDEISDNAALSLIVSSYIGRWTVQRVIEPSIDVVSRQFPDWGALVEFPELTIADVVDAALRDDRLPAGITRFVVPDRALRLKYSLENLTPGGTEAEKQESLDAMISARASQGRIRRYAEPVVILDD